MPSALYVSTQYNNRLDMFRMRSVKVDFCIFENLSFRLNRNGIQEAVFALAYQPSPVGEGVTK